MRIIGFREKDLQQVLKHNEELAERWVHIPITHAAYDGRAAMMRDLLLRWDMILESAMVALPEEEEK